MRFHTFFHKEKYNTRINRNRQVLLVCMLCCVAFIFVISGICNIAGTTEADSSFVKVEELKLAYDFLNQPEAVEVVAQDMEGYVTYQEYYEVLERFHLTPYVSTDWYRSQNPRHCLTRDIFLQTQSEVENLFEGDPTLMVSVDADLDDTGNESSAKDDSNEASFNVNKDTIVSVLLLDDNGNQTYSDVGISANAEYEITWLDSDKESKVKKAGQVVMASDLKLDNGAKVNIVCNNGTLYRTDEKSKKNSLEYQGMFTIEKTRQGYVLVNAVSIEDYLMAVVGSEMPLYFEEEALKCQAVCARSYIVNCLNNPAYPEYGATVDDSVSYQAYNKVAMDEKIKNAVEATVGQVLMSDSNQTSAQTPNNTLNKTPIEAFFFSTAPGYTADTTLWSSGLKPKESVSYIASVYSGSEPESSLDLTNEEDFRTYIKAQKESDYDSQSIYYRWRCDVDFSKGEKKLGAIWDAIYDNGESFISKEPLDLTDSKEIEPEQNMVSLDELKGLKNLYDINVMKRASNGYVQEIELLFRNGKAYVRNENYIRRIMGAMVSGIAYADQSKNESLELLPSACFYVQPIKSGFCLYGGGLGHGIGMSQYGADAMAKKGATYKEILNHYYTNVKIESLY